MTAIIITSIICLTLIAIVGLAMMFSVDTTQSRVEKVARQLAARSHVFGDGAIVDPQDLIELQETISDVDSDED